MSRTETNLRKAVRRLRAALILSTHQLSLYAKPADLATLAMISRHRALVEKTIP